MARDADTGGSGGGGGSELSENVDVLRVGGGAGKRFDGAVNKLCLIAYE